MLTIRQGIPDITAETDPDADQTISVPEKPDVPESGPPLLPAICVRPATVVSAEPTPLPPLGEIPMPEGFLYKEVFLQGQPRHSRTDPFRIRHPSMDPGRRAKLFAPFDALAGFGEAVAAKNELYEAQKEAGEEALAELNRRISILYRLTAGRLARQNRIPVTVTYYVSCNDSHSDAYRLRGQYHTLTGICEKVDPHVSQSLLVDQVRIPFRNISRIDSKAGIYDEEYA